MESIIGKKWFTEWSPTDEEGGGEWRCGDVDMGEGWPGQAFSLKVQDVLYHKRSEYQDILVFKSETYGNVLVLDGVIQCTERDEFSYQEMLAHLPLFAHPHPKKVLIIGGGDGGILREILKHSLVESVTMCEIDMDVIEASKKYLPNMSSGFNNSKLQLHAGDGLKFLQDNKNKFDVIITDSSDPLGPAETLFGENYYKLLNDSLNPNGVLSSQGESMWLHLKLIKEMIGFCRKIFPQVAYANGCVSTYPSGVIGYLLCGKDASRVLSEPSRVLSEEEVDSMGLKYYNSQVHEAAFVLPQFAKKALHQ